MTWGGEIEVTIDFKNVDASKLNEFIGAFSSCFIPTENKNKTLTVYNFVVPNLKKFKLFKFNGITSLKEADLNGIYADNVEDLSGAFQNCPYLRTLKMDNIKTDHVTNMSNMFAMCMELKKLDLRTFNTSNVRRFNGMFFECSQLDFIDLSSFDMTSADNTLGMLVGCEFLEIKLPKNKYDRKILMDVIRTDIVDDCVTVI